MYEEELNFMNSSLSNCKSFLESISSKCESDDVINKELTQMAENQQKMTEKYKDVYDIVTDGTTTVSLGIGDEIMIKETVVDGLGVTENITLDCNLTTDLGMTSMGLLYLVIAVEESFDIRFDDVGLADFATVSDVVDYIEGKI